MLKNKVIALFKEYATLLFSFLICFIFTRIYEFGLLYFTQDLPIKSRLFELNGFLLDLVWSIHFCFLFLPVFVLLYFISEKLACIVIKSLFIIALIFNLILVISFSVTLVPIDHVIFSYTYDDIMFAAKASSNTSWLQISSLVFFTVLFFIIIQKITIQIKSTPVLIATYLTALVASYSIPKWIVKPVKDDIDNFLVVNKEAYFFSQCFNYIKEVRFSKHNASVFKFANMYKKNHPGWKFINEEYPLLHINNTPDVLGPLLNLNDQKPNIVFVIVESLSKEYMGKDAKWGNFTPFLDSLSEHSLYWPNCLSTAERTFNVLPSSLGSLPYGKEGFTAMEDAMPNHFSLMQLLKEHGYYTSFYVGTWTHFNNMDGFLKMQNIDFILEQFPGYKKIDVSKITATWGYADGDLFKRSFETIDSLNKSPRLDVYLTITTHSPFIPPQQELYKQKAEDRLIELGFNENKKANYEKEIMKYACILYMDNSLRYFFNEYKKRPEFKNTIFFIFGDHAMPELDANKSKIEKYHVPFMIYSPLIKYADKFKSVVTHHDITPSILEMMANRYNMPLPDSVHWIGTGIDTIHSFSNSHQQAFMLNNKDMIDYIDGNYFLSGNQLFKIKDGLDIEPYENKAVYDRLLQERNTFKEINQYVCEKNKILPYEYYLKNNSSADISDIKEDSSSIGETKSEYLTLVNSCMLDKVYKSIDIKVNLKLKTTDTILSQYPSIVFEAYDETHKKVLWKNFRLLRENASVASDDWQNLKAFKQFDLNFMIPEHAKDYSFKLYFWNQKRILLSMDDINLIIQGNK